MPSWYHPPINVPLPPPDAARGAVAIGSSTPSARRKTADQLLERQRLLRRHRADLDRASLRVEHLQRLELLRREKDRRRGLTTSGGEVDVAELDGDHAHAPGERARHA